MPTRCNVKPTNAPDASLIAMPKHARGLTYPFGEAVPEGDSTHAIADGVRWLRLPVPGSLRHINVWVLDDEDGLAIVDTGLNLPASRDIWSAVIGDAHVSRVIVTHFHPDHLGCAGWLCEKYSASLSMTRNEYLFARMILSDVRDAPPPAARAQMKGAGWSDEQLANLDRRGWGSFARICAPLPSGIIRLQDGEVLHIGARRWTVKVGRGHAPEHACLIDFEGKLMIAGDQVLPRISSNVSVSLSEPEADPLGEWLESIAAFRTLPDDLLVMPAHGEPFYGLSIRLDQLAEGHLKSLDRLHAALGEAPRRAVDCFSLLFGRAIGDDVLSLATGEALAHLHHLRATDRAVRDERDGVWWWSAR
jgi:glyoxylase-like metal-dependent hydrolase (beta-lactamase superfamily II)